MENYFILTYRLCPIFKDMSWSVAHQLSTNTLFENVYSITSLLTIKNTSMVIIKKCVSVQ